LFGQNTDIKCITSLAKDSLIASSDEREIYFWNIQTGSKVGNFTTNFKKINSIDIASFPKGKGFYLIATGKDSTDRPNVIAIDQKGTVIKKISDFDIQKLKFVNKNDSSECFISVGKENILIWNIKNDSVLVPSIVCLGEHARNSLFTDIEVVALGLEFEKKALVSSNQGALLILNINRKEIMGVLKLHDSSILSIASHPDNHFIATSSEDGKVKMWNSDLSECLLDGKLESQVTNLEFSPRDEVNLYRIFIFLKYIIFLLL
jgi:WD40 repeat protein